MADFLLSVGVDTELSYTQMQNDITNLVNDLNKNPPKIKVAFDIDKSTTENLRRQIAEINKSVASANSGTNLGSTSRDVGRQTSAISQQYRDATKAIREYYAALTQLSKSKSDISLTPAGWKSASGNYNELAGALNRTKTAFDLVSNSMQSMPTSQQAQLQALLTSETNKYNIAVEQQANKERIAAESAAQKVQTQRAATAEKQASTAATKQAIAAAKEEASAQKAQISSARQADMTIKSYGTSIIQCETALRNWTAAEHSKNSSSREAYQSFKSSVEAARSAKNAHDSGSGSLENFRAKTEAMRASLKSTERTLKENGDATKTWSERIGGLAGKFGYWLTASQIIMQGIRAIREMVGCVVELDTAMTELKKVTDETDATYEKFLVNATSRAKQLGAALSDTVTATADFARLGFSIEEAEKLADTAIVYKNVGDGIKDISEASESIIATMQAFGIAADDAMTIVDKFNEVGNNYAISSEGVGEALLRSAAAMHAANNSLDETIALATAANTIVQDPEKVGKCYAQQYRNVLKEDSYIG